MSGVNQGFSVNPIMTNQGGGAVPLTLTDYKPQTNNANQEKLADFLRVSFVVISRPLFSSVFFY